MSWDVNIIDHETREVRVLQEAHHIVGGTYAIGDQHAYLNVTYNYGQIYQRFWGDRTLRYLHDKKVAEVIAVLDAALAVLPINREANYWEATEGNAGAALNDLRELCKLCEPTDTVRVS